ncbi:MAG: PRC-barrel domain-containing protein [Nanoarchaeota archaeon]
MLKVKKISEILGKKVFTDTGDFFGEVEEVNIVENKIDGWRIRVAGEFGGFLGGARGVIIPHQFVRAIGTIMLVARSSLPNNESMEESMPSEEEAM